MNCKECIHFEVCAYVSHYLQACDSYKEPVKHGKWIVNGRLWECSICRETKMKIITAIHDLDEISDEDLSKAMYEGMD